MSLRTKVFIRSVLLSVFLIALIIVVHGVYTLDSHHGLMDQRYIEEITTRATEVERLMLWDDRVAVTKLLKSVTDADHCVAYAFVEREGQPYAQTFPDGVPRMLLGRPASPTPKEWHFKSENGEDFDDFVMQVGNSSAVLHIGLSVEEMANEMAPLLKRIAVIGAVSTLLAILLSMFLARWTTSEVNRSTDALRKNEEKYRGIFDESVAAVYIFDSEKNFIDSNQSGLDLLGYSRKELLSMSIPDVDADPIVVLPAHKQLLSGDRIINYEHQLKRKDGRIITVLNNSRPLTDARSNVIGMQSTLVDITERKQAEEALAQSEDRFRKLFQLAPLGYQSLDEKGNFLEVNDTWCQTLGYSREEVIGRNFAEFIDPDFKDVFERCFPMFKDAGSIDDVEYTMIKKDGTRIIAAFTGRVGYNDDGLFKQTHCIFADITERKRAEDALRESEEKYKGIVESSHDAIMLTRPDGIISYMSPACKQVLGYDAEELVGRQPWIVHPDDLEKVQKIFYKAMQGESGSDFEYRIDTKTNQTKWVSHSWSPILDDGKVQLIVSVVRDVTERKQAEEALRESEERFRQIVERSSDVFYRQNFETIRFEYMSPNVRDILGYTPEEMSNLSFEEQTQQIHPDDLPNLIYFSTELVEADERGEKHVEREFRLRRKSGEYIWVHGSYNLVRDDHGEPHLIVGSLQDITERKLAEEANARLSRAIEQAGETIVITDAEGTIQYVNPAFEEITGYTAKEAIGENPRLLKSGQHDDVFYMKMWKTLSSGNRWSGEITNKKKDGTLFTENAVISPVFDSQGKTVNYVAAKNDITEVKRLRELESRAQRLETAGQIAGQVAHDFNNLLAPIMAYPEFIRDELPHDHKAHAYLDAIEKAATKIADINQDLLTMGRRGHYNQEVLDLNRVALQAAQEMESRTKTVKVELELAEDLMKIKGGAAQIHRMLTNLLVNAQDAMEDIGQVTIKTENYYADDTAVAFGRVPKGEYVKLTISDTGCGIADEIKQRILDPFFTTKTTDKKRGSGLGLSVVNAVMKDHAGYLDLNSKVGYGTSFYLYFPVTREGADADASEPLAGGTETMLVVDDDDTQREVSAQLLTKLGYRVSSVGSGEQAIEFLRENPQDLVILDMVMPGGIDGTETYRRILEIRSNQKAIILSGFSESDRVLEAQKLGAGAFVRKPVTKQVIAAAVRTELDRPVEVAAS